MTKPKDQARPRAPYVPAERPTETSAAEARRARLADALRDNLQKRKAQARARGAKATEEPES